MVVGLQLTLLGPFRAAVDGAPIENKAWRRRKAAALVKLLALQPGGRLHRDQVLDLLWPAYEVEAALNNFHQALHGARRALEPTGRAGRFLRWNGEVLELSPAVPVVTDVQVFQERATVARRSDDLADLAAAVALYSGDLLVEDLYEDWSIPAREALRATFLDLLRRFADRLYATGDAAAAIEVAGRLVAAEPLDDAAQLRLIELLAATGRRREALNQLNRFREVFRRELDADLPPAAVAIERRLIGGSSGEDIAAPATSFVGRRHELDQLMTLLQRSRLVTLVGPGGVGKSRLALELLARQLDAWTGGIGVAELATVDAPAQLPHAVARSLGAEPHADPLEAIIRHYRERRALVLLDNCEHLITDVAHLIACLLRACPGLRILATSREPLAIAGEVVWRLAPLAAPTGPEDTDAESVRLFLDRARLQRPTFEQTAEHIAAIAEICQRVDGLPLAIELAAARVGSLTPSQIALRLAESGSLLDRGHRLADRRHQTIEAAIEWSYVLLSPEEQAVLRRVAVLGGEFSLELAEQVARFGGLAARPVLPLLTSLVEKSLVSVDLTGGEARYRLLEVVRQFAVARLDEEEARAARRRRRAWAFALVAQAAPRLGERDERLWLDRLERDYHHIRAALDDALADDATEDALDAGGYLWRFWQSRGRLVEGLRWLTDALARGGGVPSAARARALNGAGGLANDLGDDARAVAAHEECLAIWRALGNRSGVASSLNNLGNSARRLGDLAAADRFYAESLSLFEALGETGRQALVLLNRGKLERGRGQTAAAERAFELSLALYRDVGDLQGTASALNRLGDLARERGETALARRLHDEAFAIQQQRGDRWGQAIALNYLGQVALADGDPAGATALAQAALRLLHDVPVRHEVGVSLSIIGLAQVAAGRPELGATLLGAVDGLRLPPEERPPLPEDERLSPARRAGRLLALEAAVARALDAPAVNAPPTRDRRRHRSIRPAAV
jgi:predicted ATPase/DNA-binding SARP family transcriptional activator